MSDRSCPSCHEPVLAHQTLCPVCRTPVPSEAGPVAAESTAFTFTAPPPRRARPSAAPEPSGPAPPEPTSPEPTSPEPTDEPGYVVGTAPVPDWAAPPGPDPAEPEPASEPGPAPAPDPEPAAEPAPPPEPADPGTLGPFVVGPSPAPSPTAPEPTVPAPDVTAVLGAPAAWASGADATAVAPTPAAAGPAEAPPAWDPHTSAPAGPPAAPSAWESPTSAPAESPSSWDRPAWDPQAAAPVGPGSPVSAGTLGTPGAAVLDERGNLPGGIVGLVAAALVTIGVFLPWIAVDGTDVSGWAASDDAKVLLGIAGLATVIAALLIGGARSLVLRLAMVGLGVVALGLGAFEITSANGIEDFDVSLGTGLFLVLAGGVALAVAGVLTRHRRFL